MKNGSIDYYHNNRIPINWDSLTLENREKLIDDIVNKKGYARVISLIAVGRLRRRRRALLARRRG